MFNTQAVEFAYHLEKENNMQQKVHIDLTLAQSEAIFKKKYPPINRSP